MPEIKFYRSETKNSSIAPLQKPRIYNKKFLESYASTVDEYPEQPRSIVKVYVTKDSNVIQTDPNVLELTSPGIVREVDACYDQRNRLWVAWRDDTATYLYWYDSAIPGFTTTVYPLSERVLLFMTDLNYYSSIYQTNYAVLLMQLNGVLEYRTQDERFQQAWPLTTIQADEVLDTAGMSTQWRIQVAIDGNAIGQKSDEFPNMYGVIVNDSWVGVDYATIVEDIENE